MTQHIDRDLERVLTTWLLEGSDGLADRDAILRDVRGRLPSTPRRSVAWSTRLRAVSSRPVVPGFHVTTRLRSGPSTVVVATALAVMLTAVMLILQPLDHLRPSVPAGQEPPAATVFPRPGPLPQGTYGAIVDGVSFTFSLRGGEGDWESSPKQPGVLHADSYGTETWPRASAWVSFGTIENVYADPCAGVPLSPPVGPTTADLAAALAAIPGVETSVREMTVIGGAAGSAKYVQLTLADDVECGADALRLWYRDGQDIVGTSRRLRAADSKIGVVIIDVGGQRFVVDREWTPFDRSASLTTATTIQFQDLPADALEYADRVRVICTTASDRFASDPHVAGGFREGAPGFATLDGAVAHADAAIRIADAAFRELAALRVPVTMEAEAATFQDSLESAIGVLRQVPAAARTGDAERVSALMTEAYLQMHAPWGIGHPWEPFDDRLLSPSFAGCVLPSGGG